MDWRLAKNARPLIYFLATVHQIVNVFGDCHRSSAVQILENSARVLVFPNFKWFLSKGGRLGLRTVLGERPGRLERAKVTRDVKGRMVIRIKLVEALFEEQLHLLFEFADHHVVVGGTNQIFEFFEDVV